LEKLIIATANTRWGSMVYTPAGLTPVASAGILLLQEVTEPERYDLAGRLRAAGFELVHCTSRFGLAIAVRTDSGLRLVPGSIQERLLQKMSPIEQWLTERIVKHPPGIRERGLITAKFTTLSGRQITVVNTHPITPIAVRPRARKVQIARIGTILADPYYSGMLILAGDMNHYPGPKKIDEAMRATAKLTRVNLGLEPTWYVRGSKQEKWFTIPAHLLHKPIDSYNGQHDVVLYRGKGLRSTSVKVVDIPSDHRAIVATFSLF
jgi:endonuclease/exonuclease/phosphatase family metal-dependent hydrolase